MGIRFTCPSGHKLNVKTFLAGKRGVCPQCGAKFVIPVPAELQNANERQTVATAQSQTIAAISPTAIQTGAMASSPSIIIQVADTNAAHESASPQKAANIANLAVAPTANPAVAAPPAPPSFVRPGSRRRFQIVISASLFLLVLLLAIVLFIVMSRQFSQPPVPKKSPPATTRSALPVPHHNVTTVRSQAGFIA